MLCWLSFCQEDLVGCPSFAEVAQQWRDFLDGCDLAGYNAKKFDVPMLRYCRAPLLGKGDCHMYTRLLTGKKPAWRTRMRADGHRQLLIAKQKPLRQPTTVTA
jgi:hypothetical protein